MEAMSKYFKLDNRKSFWQSGIYRKATKTEKLLSAFKTYKIYE